MAELSLAEARKVAKKLKAEIAPGRKHDRASVFHKGRLVLWFGISRASNRDKGSGHIPRAIHVKTREAKLLAQCPMSRDEWVERMRQKGIIDW